jgi:alpha-mannosidase
LPQRFSFVSVHPDNVVLSALKKPLGIGRRGMILRIFESAGRKTEARIRFPWPVIVRRADILENLRDVLVRGEKELSIPLRPHEIKTIHVVKWRK